MGRIVLVEPLMKYYEVSDDADALELCAGLVAWAVHPDTCFFDAADRFSGSLRWVAAGVAALARFAAATGDDRLLDRVEGMLQSMLARCTSYGATPEGEPCCANMELTTAAIALSRAGRGPYWDMVDRHFRNQTLACQFTDPQALHRGYEDGEPGPEDDTRDIVARSVGGFSWASAREHSYRRAHLMLCCGGNAMWTLGRIVEHAATVDGDDLWVHLHFGLDTGLVTLANAEPFDGRLEVVPRRAGGLRIRRPAHAGPVRVEVDGAPVSGAWVGDYLHLDRVREGGRVVLTYPLEERTTEERTWTTPYATRPNSCFGGPKPEPQVAEEVRATWRGNTVLAVDDAESPWPRHRLYADRAEGFRRGAGRGQMASFYLPAEPFTW